MQNVTRELLISNTHTYLHTYIRLFCGICEFKNLNSDINVKRILPMNVKPFVMAVVVGSKTSDMFLFVYGNQSSSSDTAVAVWSCNYFVVN